jgi:hypothetical protein
VRELIGKLVATPEGEQKQVAAFLLEDVKAEERWNELFEATTDEQWDKLAGEALAEFERGETEPLAEALGNS